MEIKKITHNKKKYIELLLLADEQESMIDKYLEGGEMFALYDSDLKSVCVVTCEDFGVYEIKNIATKPEYQGKGYGKKLIAFLFENYTGKCKTMLVGTGDSPLAILFYQKCGFTESHCVKNFFKDNYDHPIFECGKPLVDMVYLKKDFACVDLVKQHDRNSAAFIDELTQLWAKSVRASHDFLSETDIASIFPFVRSGLTEIPNLIVATVDNNTVGFMGIAENKIEMLFLQPEYFGKDIGKQLVTLAINEYAVKRVDVNEQNPKAKSFYEHFGFEVYKRTEIDEQGNSFPILKMKLPNCN